MNGGSHNASFVMASPLAAASRARAAPEDVPYTDADPPASLMRASISSISRSTAYGAVSPLSPRPRRSPAPHPTDRTRCWCHLLTVLCSWALFPHVSSVDHPRPSGVTNIVGDAPTALPAQASLDLL